MRFRLFRRLWRWLLPSLCVLGLVSIGFVLGAAVMHFEWPTHTFLHNSFKAAVAVLDKNKGDPPDHSTGQPIAGAVDKPDKTCDGFTLYTTDAETTAFLVDMRGEMVHSWALPFSKVWPGKPPHFERRPVADSSIYFCGFHLYSNGDLLVVYQTAHDTPYGYGLVKLNKNSEVIWKYARHVHHEVDVGDDGRIYAVAQEFVMATPKGMHQGAPPYLIDHLVVLSPEGKELQDVRVLEALQNSKYAPLAASLGKVTNHVQVRNLPGKGNDDLWDILHTNCVKVLSPSLAPKFPMFREGQLLVSIRELDTIGVLDLEATPAPRFIWAAQGTWRKQHSPCFLDTGNLLIFDNQGPVTGSRLLEYDPQTQAFPWSYPDDPGPAFNCSERGICQRLPNGNTFIVNAEAKRILEITGNGELVWDLTCGAYIASARRYTPKDLSFLDKLPRQEH